MNLMAYLYVKTLFRTFGMVSKNIETLIQDMLNWKYVTIFKNTQIELRVSELSVKRTGKILHKLFKAVVNELKIHFLP